MRPIRPRILSVDADPRIHRWLRRSFRSARLDCDLDSVMTGRAAFDMLTDDSYDICLTEYALPDITGVQLCGLLRQTGVNIPVIFLSVMDRPVDTERAAQAGADLYISKADGADKIVAAVREMLGIPPAYNPVSRPTPRPARAA